MKMSNKIRRQTSEKKSRENSQKIVKKLLLQLKWKDAKLKASNCKYKRLKNQLEAKSREIRHLKTQLNRKNSKFRKLESKSIHSVNCQQESELPTDEISCWIQKPGLKHLATIILSYLDARSLARCKSVSYIWHGFITSEKQLLKLQLIHIKNFPIETNIGYGNKTKCYKTLFEALEECQHLFKWRFGEIKEWDDIFELMNSHETLDCNCPQKCLFNFYYQIRECALRLRNLHGLHLTPPKILAFRILNCLPTFEEIVKLNPMTQLDVEYFIDMHPDDKKEDLKTILKCLNIQGNINEFNIPLRLYSLEKPIETLELLFKTSQEYGIDMNIPNKEGKTLLEIARERNETDIIALYEKYKT